MFAKVFEQIFDSSIAEDWQARVVFEDMLILADQNGVVDKTYEAIARRTNVPIDIVKTGIKKLEAPDPQSRNPKHDGRRIVRLDEHREWGWLIVNYEEYRKIASEEQRREKTLERVRKYRDKNKDVTQCNASLRNVNDSPYASIYTSTSGIKKGGAGGKNFKQWTREEFELTVRENNTGMLPPDELIEFVDYWFEPMANGKARLYSQKAWDTKRRLRTWAKKAGCNKKFVMLEVSDAEVFCYLPTSDGDYPVSKSQIKEWENSFPNCNVKETVKTEMVAKLKAKPTPAQEALSWCVNQIIKWNAEG